MISYDPAHRQTAYLTDVGQVRSENQDACSEFCDPGTGTQLLVVADGMGGHQGGATASRMAIETVGEVFQRAQLRGPDMLVEALSSANGRIFDAATQHSELRGMGTTCVALLINRDGSDHITTAHHILPAEKARFAGEAVAMVVGETLAVAKDGRAAQGHGLSNTSAEARTGRPHPIAATSGEAAQRLAQSLDSTRAPRDRRDTRRPRYATSLADRHRARPVRRPRRQ